ncbi:MAG: hypothetical protein HY900_34080 [Deltaproteobacteria bacterium]|nr:hypothetical protein [Deltaproteobacteria bacterium]
MQIFFAEGELAGHVCNALNAYHWTGVAWESLPLDTSWGGDWRVCPGEGSAPYSVRVYPVTNFSPFVLSSNGSVPVEVTSFTAE